MAEFPEDIKYTDTHEWARADENGLITVGITDHAQDALGDIVYVQAPELDQHVYAGEEVATIESVKAASDVYTPISGRVVAINDALRDTPEIINAHPYQDGWIYVLEPDDPRELDGLLDAQYYASLCTDPQEQAED